MTEQEKPSPQKPLFEKGELHEIGTPENEFIPGVGIAPVDSLKMLWGDEDAILNKLRQMGFSEEAIAAFKSGKAVQATSEDTPFGTLRTEKWEGKEEKKETNES